MLFRVLAVGDVVGDAGLDTLHRHLRTLIRKHEVHFTVVNGENAAGVGLLPRQAEEMFDAGATVVTLGNHTWDKQQIVSYLEDSPYLLRPANYKSSLPGRGLGIYEGPKGLRVAVLSLMGRLNLNPHLSSPFETADELLSGLDADIILVDFHAETTSEKGAFAWYLDGRVQAVWGTHTHVPTADVQVLPQGCGFVSDLGMTGPRESVLGIAPQDSINLFLGGLPRRYQTATGPVKLDCVLFTIDTETRRCTEVRRCDIWD